MTSFFEAIKVLTLAVALSIFSAYISLALSPAETIESFFMAGFFLPILYIFIDFLDSTYGKEAPNLA